MNKLSIIDLKEWNISYSELVKWCEETGADVYAIIHHGGNGQPSAQYGFEKEEDLLAFTLAFHRDKVTYRTDFFDNGNGPGGNYF